MQFEERVSGSSKSECPAARRASVRQLEERVSDAQKQRMQLRIGQQLGYLGDQRDCYEFYQIEHDVSLLATNEKLPLVRTCGEMQSMHGIYGYSLDGREDGETDFEEECLGAGELFHEHHRVRNYPCRLAHELFDSPRCAAASRCRTSTVLLYACQRRRWPQLRRWKGVDNHCQRHRLH